MKITRTVLLTTFVFAGACGVHGASAELQKIALVRGADHAYELQGRAPWKPVRVWSDGERTMIDFPAAVRPTQLPSLVLLSSEGQCGADEPIVYTHYDRRARRMTVDSVVDRAVLLAVAGHDQVRVKIQRLTRAR